MPSLFKCSDQLPNREVVFFSVLRLKDEVSLVPVVSLVVEKVLSKPELLVVPKEL